MSRKNEEDDAAIGFSHIEVGLALMRPHVSSFLGGLAEKQHTAARETRTKTAR